MNEPPLGCIGVVDTKSFFGKIIKWFTRSPVCHAVVYVGNNALVEGEPGGAQTAPWDKYGDKMIWLTEMSRIDIDGVPVGVLEPTEDQRHRIASWALACAVAKVGYNFWDIAILALCSPRLDRINPNKPPWWAKRLASNGALVCSQLVDNAWAHAGLDVFVGRVPGFVTPGDLWRAGGSPPVP